MKKAKVNDVIHVRFYDHCQYKGIPGQVGESIEFDVYGKVVSITERSIELASWSAVNSQYADNNEGFSILLSTITSLRVLGKK